VNVNFSSDNHSVECELEAESLTTSALNQHFSTIAFEDLLCVEPANPELRQMLSRPLSETVATDDTEGGPTTIQLTGED